eukprot:scaffold3504_cov240-Pinguiococcus_pyrenoidosus.AAC.35
MSQAPLALLAQGVHEARLSQMIGRVLIRADDASIDQMENRAGCSKGVVLVGLASLGFAQPHQRSSLRQRAESQEDVEGRLTLEVEAGGQELDSLRAQATTEADTTSVHERHRGEELTGPRGEQGLGESARHLRPRLEGLEVAHEVRVDDHGPGSISASGHSADVRHVPRGKAKGFCGGEIEKLLDALERRALRERRCRCFSRRRRLLET